MKDDTIIKSKMNISKGRSDEFKDVAAMLSLSQPSVLRLVDAGEIPFVLYGRTRMYRRRDVMAYIEDMETHKGRNTNGVA